MQTKDFSVFRTLLTEVHVKAFGESISKLPHGKANTLAFLIEEATGVMLSYKSLSNYMNAVLEENADKVNPNCTTLAILVQFTSGEKIGRQAASLWFKYRTNMLSSRAQA